MVAGEWESGSGVATVLTRSDPSPTTTRGEVKGGLRRLRSLACFRSKNGRTGAAQSSGPRAVAMVLLGVRRGAIPSNPPEDVKKPEATNTDRQQYVPAEVIETLIELEPDLEWRALLALARYQGVRTPSEPFSPKRFRSSCSGIRSVGSNCGIRVRCRLRGRGRKVPRLSPRSAGLRRGAAS